MTNDADIHRMTKPLELSLIGFGTDFIYWEQSLISSSPLLSKLILQEKTKRKKSSMYLEMKINLFHVFNIFW